jgi:hypothetical protein
MLVPADIIVLFALFCGLFQECPSPDENYEVLDASFAYLPAPTQTLPIFISNTSST